MLLRKENIGGGVVRRGFTVGSDWLKPGTPLTRAEILAFPQANLQALHDGGQLDVYPPGAPALETDGAQAAAQPLPRVMIWIGGPNFVVVEGRLLTSPKGVPKAVAEAMVEGKEAEGDPPKEGEVIADPPNPAPPVEEPPPAS